MRISDWSSDVCSSDLVQLRQIANSGQSVRKAQPAKLSAEPALVRQRDQILDWLHSCEISGARASIIPGTGSDRSSKFRRHRAEPNIGKMRNQIGRASCRERVCQYV